MLISHPAEKNFKEKPLRDHLLNVAELSRKGMADLRLDLTLISHEELQRLSFLIGVLHDFGKATPYFQAYIRDREKKADQFTHHGFLSALIGHCLVKAEMKSDLFSYVAYQVIKNHHGDLEAFDASNNDIHTKLKTARTQLDKCLQVYYGELKEFYLPHIPHFDIIEHIDMDELKEVVEESDFLIEESLGEEEDKRLELFFITNLLFSFLIDSDKKDAARLDTDYFSGNLKEPPGQVQAFIEQSKKENPGKFGGHIPINKLRDQFMAEITTNPHISPDRHFYTLTAPTGIGKTYGCLAFADKLIERLPGQSARIIYCLPYTSIIDQNFSEFEKIIRFNKGAAYEQRPTRYLLKHHHLAGHTVKNRVVQEEYCYKDYLDDRLLVESWESALIVTTFVQFFHTVIGYKNRMLKKFHRIVNSVVILDEVQNINPDYYQLLKQVFHILGERFHTYFLLTTATQPEIFDLERSKPISLVDSAGYTGHSLFNRVKLIIEKQPQDLGTFKERFCREFNGDNCLIVFNTKGAAEEMFRFIKENKPEYRVLCLTTNLVPVDRRDKIEFIKQALLRREKIILVSTQLIEAGVDISFKNVYRDFGPFDSIIQVAGRCNRSGEYGELGGTMTLVRLINENHQGREFHSYIYKPIIAQYVEKTMRENIYESKDFLTLTRDYFSRFDFERESRRLLNAIHELNYDRDNIKDQTPVKDFKLIDEYDTEGLFILTTLVAQASMERLQLCLAKLYEEEIAEPEKETLLFEIEGLKATLKDYQISLREKDLENYEKKDIIKGEGPYRYISHEDQARYAYDAEAGFLKEPKEQISGVICF
ncbi:MAG: CRISPR-associated helicase Cas3' [Candidatus Aminicenantes bacterium]|nr:CRISPR-associated helicase Cas3' [Candidatus Aminicenantes bacterium]